MQLRGKPRKKWLDNLIGFGLQLVIVSFKRRNVHGPNLMEIAFKRHQNLTVTCLRSLQNLSVNHVVERKTEKKALFGCSILLFMCRFDFPDVRVVVP